MAISFTEESLGSILQNGNIQQAAKTISEDLQLKQTDSNDFIGFITSLGFALTSTTIELRCKATELLSETLTNLPNDFFDATELKVIINFYCDRAKDHHSVLPNVLTGILAVVRAKAFPSDMVSHMLPILFYNVPCQSQTWCDRQKYFQIIQILSENHSEGLYSMGADFVYGVINSMDGERDPRLLMYIFEFLPKFLKKIPLYHLTDEMFEVIACYFPIDFFPSADHPKAITRQSLADHLSACLCGSTQFADNCIELALEKIDSQLKVAKLDSLDLLAKAALAFGASDIEQHFQSIWSILKTYLIPDADKELATASLHTLQSIVQTTSADTLLCANVLNIIFETILLQFGDVCARNFQPSITVALTCAKAHPFATTLCTEKVTPLLLELLEVNHDNFLQRCQLINILISFMMLQITNNIDPNNDALQRIHNELLACIDTDSTVDLNVFNTGLNALARINKTIPLEQRSQIYRILKNHLQTLTINPNVHFAFHEFALSYPAEILLEIVTDLTDPTHTAQLDRQSADNLFTALRSCIEIIPLQDPILIYLFRNATEKSSIQLTALRTIRQILQQNLTDSTRTVLHSKFHIVTEIFTLAQMHDDIDSNIFDELSNILGQIFLRASPIDQREMIEKYLPKLKIVENDSDLYIAIGLLKYFNRNIESNYVVDFILELTEMTLNSIVSKMVENSNRLLCSLLNKLITIPLYEPNIQKSIEMTKEKIRNEKSPKALRTLAWMTKGLIVNGHRDAAELIELFLTLIDTDDLLGKSIPSIFQILSDNDDDADYNSDIYDIDLPVKSFLYKQKFFQIVLNSLWTKLAKFNEHHFTVMAYVCKATPHQVLTFNIEKIGTILFKAIEQNAILPVQISLEIIKQFLLEKNIYFGDHLQHLISSFIKHCHNKNSMKIRIISIECLSSLCKSYPTIILLPYKLDVIRGLNEPLDDSKRLVRTAAVVARNRWYLLETNDVK